MEYGTGAIMAVPGHDERDFEFAERYGLPIVRRRRGRGRRGGRRGRAAHTENEAACSNSAQFDGLPRRGQTRDRPSGWSGQRRARRVGTGCTTGASRASATGAADPDHLLRPLRCGAGAREAAPGAAPVDRGLPPDTPGVSPLAARRGVVPHVPCPACGGQARRETDVTDTFLDCVVVLPALPGRGVRRPAVRPAR